MAETTYTYSISADMPGGAVSTSNLDAEIRTSSIVTALERIDVTGDVLDIIFKDSLSAGDKTILDGDTTSPAGGLLADHDSVDKVTADSVTIANQDIKVTAGKRSDAKILYMFSPDLCDKKTWYLDAIKVVAEDVTAVTAADGTKVTWTLDCGGDSNAKILQVYGYVASGYALAPHGGQPGEYLITATVDGNAMQQDRPHKTAGDRDFSIDSDARTITFHTAPASGVTVTVNYWYVPDGALCHLMKLKCPPAGKKWTIDYVEAQFAKNVEMMDTIIFGAYPFESGRGYTIYSAPLQPELHYTTMQEVTDYNIGSKPIIPAVGTNSRGYTQDKIVLPWEYVEELSVNNTTVDMSGYGAPFTANELVELNARLESGIPFTGERATITIRVLEEDDTTQ